jgi:glycosyltransferase involved in cell wall biosynthesis
VRVCIVAHAGADLFGHSSGGAEKQLALLARHLARRGHEVVMVVPGWRWGAAYADGVRLLPGWERQGGVRWLRAITYRVPRLREVLASVGADCYYARGVNYYTSIMVRTARRVGAKSLVALASDRDLFHESGRHGLALGLGPLDRPVGWLAHVHFEHSTLRAADLIVTQNDEQSASCVQLGLRHAKMPSIVELPPDGLRSATEEFDAVWVGTVRGGSRRSKGVQELLSLIRALPQLRIAVVGGLTASHVSKEAETLRGLPNAVVLGRLEHAGALDCMAKARVTVNTSPSEGFSNVMLEGWSLGKPAVTLNVDPSRLLSERGLGVCAKGDMHAMCSALHLLAKDDERRRAMGEKCRAFVVEENSPERVCDLFEGMVRALSCGSVEH